MYCLKASYTHLCVPPSSLLIFSGVAELCINSAVCPRSFGGFLGVYSGTKCSMVVARGGTQDSFNAGVAGALAGCMGSLRTRNPTVIGTSAAISGCLMMVIESIQGTGL